MLERRPTRLATALALVAVLGLCLPASALPLARQSNLAGWTLDSLFDWFSSIFSIDGGRPELGSRNVEKLGSIGGSGSGGNGGTGGGTGGSTGSGGNGSSALPDGAPLPGSP